MHIRIVKDNGITERLLEVSATFIFSGLSCYFQGHGVEEGKGTLLWTCYDPETTVRDLVEGWVGDFDASTSPEEVPEEVESGHVRSALVEMFNREARAEYSDALVGKEVPPCALAQELDRADYYDEHGELREGELPQAVVVLSVEEVEDTAHSA